MSYIYKLNSNFEEIMNGESGLTLIEMLIAVAFTGAVLLIASNMLIQSYNIFYGGTERMTASQAAEITVSQLANDIRASENVDGNCIDGENSDEITIDNGDIVYKFEDTDTMNGTIEREGDGENRTIAHNVEELCVDNTNDNFKITLIYVDRDGVEKRRSTSVRRRN